MRLFTKYRLVPADESTTRVQETKENMLDILNSDQDPSLKLAQYRNLLSKLVNYQKHLEEPPKVHVQGLDSINANVKSLKKRLLKDKSDATVPTKKTKHTENNLEVVQPYGDTEKFDENIKNEQPEQKREEVNQAEKI